MPTKRYRGATNMPSTCLLNASYQPATDRQTLPECATATLVQPWGYFTATTRLAMNRMHLRRTQSTATHLAALAVHLYHAQHVHDINIRTANASAPRQLKQWALLLHRLPLPSSTINMNICIHRYVYTRIQIFIPIHTHNTTCIYRHLYRYMPSIYVYI